MFLSNQTIEKYIDEGKITINPDFDKKNIRPVGVRIHLGKTILIPAPNQTIDLTGQQDLKYREVDLEIEEFYLEPNGFILGVTYEAIQTSKDIITFLDGRSTVARVGLTTHITSFVIDGTFEAPHTIVLEMKNVGNFRIRLKWKDPIAMIFFAQLKEKVTHDLQSRYIAGQNTVTPPNLTW